MKSGIGADNVWAAYLALARYVRRVGYREGVHGTQIPARLAPMLPQRHRLLAAGTAGRLTSLDMDFPRPGPPHYLAYVFLFQQLLRLSFSTHPHYDPVLGWRAIQWVRFPIVASVTEKAERTWVGWLKQNHPWQTVQEIYPWIELPGRSELEIVRRQVGILYALAERKSVTPETIIARYDIVGAVARLDHPPYLRWHPWIHLGFPRSWKGEGIVRAHRYAFELIQDDPESWRVFWEEAVPLLHPRQLTSHRILILSHLDSLFGSSNMPEAARERYRRVRRKSGRGLSHARRKPAPAAMDGG